MLYRLDSKDLQHILDLILLYYSYLETGGKLRDILSEMLKLFRANDVVFFSGNRDLNGIDWTSSFSLYGEKTYLSQYANHFWRYDPLYQAQFCTRPIRPVFKTDDIIPYSQLVKLEYYNNFLRPQDQLGELIIRVCSGKKFFGVIAIQRSKNQPKFNNTDIQKAKLLVPHLTNTFETANLLSTIDKERRALEHCLESQPNGIILLDSGLYPLYYNSKAKRVCCLLSGKTAEAIRDIEGAHFFIPSLLREDCKALRRLSKDNSQPSHHSYRITSTEHNKRFQVEYSLVRQSSRELSTPCFIIYLKDLTESKKSAREAGIDRCGLTRRERVIAQYVSSGLNNKEIAEQLFISKFTVENHLKRIFEKTGVNNRTQLANWMQFRLPICVN